MEIKYYIQIDELHNIINSTCVVNDTTSSEDWTEIEGAQPNEGVALHESTSLGEDWILIESTEWCNLSKYRKYNPIDKVFYDEMVIVEEPSHEQITQETHSTVETSSFDNLINMDMLLGLDDKLNTIIKHLGINI